MIVPLGTDRDGRRPPRATVLLIALNVAVYIAMMTGAAAFWTDRDLVDQLRAVVSVDHRVSDLDLYRQIFVSQMWAEPGVTPWWSLFTAMFTHDPNSILHIAGNMIFLWAFGKSIESHLGFWRFLILYLAGGMAAWGVHALLGGGPAIGASGATSSVACLFLAFFPRSHTRVLYLIGMSLHYVSKHGIVSLIVREGVRKQSEVTPDPTLGPDLMAVLGGHVQILDHVKIEYGHAAKQTSLSSKRMPMRHYILGRPS